MPDRHTITLHRIVREELRHLVGERKLSLFCQKKDRCSRKLLRDGTDFVCGMWRRWDIQLKIREAVTLRHDGLIAFDNRNRSACHPPCLDRRLHDGVNFHGDAFLAGSLEESEK